MQTIGEAQHTAAAALRPEDFAEVAAHMPHLMTRDLDDVFAHIVRHLLAGLAADLAETAAHSGRTPMKRVASGGRK
jgi:hypothetical protein